MTRKACHLSLSIVKYKDGISYYKICYTGNFSIVHKDATAKNTISFRNCINVLNEIYIILYSIDVMLYNLNKS